MGAFDHELQNVVQTGVGFLFILFAFNSQALIEQSVITTAAQKGDIDKFAGYRSLAILYFFFFIGNFPAVPIIEHTSAKWAMIGGGVCYALFQIGFLFLNEMYLYISSAIIGFGAAILWTGQGNYLALVSTGENSRRNSGILWAIFQSSIATGGTFLLGIFTFVASGQSIEDDAVKLLYSIFTGFNVVGIIILALLRNPVQTEPKAKIRTKETLGSTFYLMKTKKMLLLAFAFGFTGFETTMWTGVFPTTISYTQRLGSNTNALIATYAIATGTGQIIGGFVFGILGEQTKRFGRHNIVLSGMVLHLITFLLIFVNFPAEASLGKTDKGGFIEPSILLAMLSGFLLGLCDSIWNTQLYAFLVDNYKTQSSQAFALFKSYQALCAASAFFYGTVINLHWQLLILAIAAVLGGAGFYLCEMVIEKERKSSSAVEELDPETKSYTYAVDLGPIEERRPSTDSEMAPTVDLELRTVVQVGIGFFCVLFAFLTQSIIEQAVISSAAERGDIGEHAGYLSLAIIYFFFFVGNFVAVPVIECTNAKWTMTAGAASFIFFQVGFLHLKEYYLYASSAVLGFGSGFFWTGQGSYLAQISKAKNSRRNSGILWALFQSSIAVGGMFLLAIFTFVSTEQKISERTVTLLYTVFSAANVVGVLVLALLPNATTYGVELLNSPRKNFDVLETFASIFHVLTSKKMFLIGFAFCFTGLSNSMYSSVYSTVIAFTKRLGTNTNALMAIYAIVMGSGQIVGGCVFGLLGEKTKRLGRKNIIIGGMALHLATFSAIFVNFPAEASLKATDDVSLIEPSITIAMVCGFMLGLGDAIWNTQIYAFLVDNYSTRSSQAFAIYKATQVKQCYKNKTATRL
ncbi:hypothetical protein QR680_017982 [Steinernema hermaphroditum]|uniref:UNC93-like protein MFSD11 n=1 Tax=Steinernema hermaphroditum TaxID=289476 RepID=A0AA39HIV6_9BILA|nr:hypothetical protein QR680_017982 [Steinernema hermaphroditum]